MGGEDIRREMGAGWQTGMVNVEAMILIMKVLSGRTFVYPFDNIEVIDVLMIVTSVQI